MRRKTQGVRVMGKYGELRATRGRGQPSWCVCRVMGEETGGWKLELGGAQGDGGSEGDEKIRRTERDKEEDNQAGVCAG